MPATSFIYDRHGYVLQRVYEQHRILVTSDQLPRHLKQALVAREDERFYWHSGFDPVSILRALWSNISRGRIVSGASTITQQLARNSAEINAPNLDRKIKEMLLAVRIELAFSKDEILLYYFNRVFFGSHLYGIGAAAEAYFGKSAKDLSLSESAMLVGIIAGPNLFSPWKNPELARKVRNTTLDRMVAENFIPETEAEQIKKEPLILRPRVDLPGSYAVAAILETLPDYLTRQHIYRGGLHIYTTLDLAFQRAAEEELARQLISVEQSTGYRNQTRAQWLRRSDPSNEDKPEYLQGAFVAMHNADGGVLALIGGRNYQESSYNRALYGKRQIGSTVKPFIYAHVFNLFNGSAFTKINATPFDLQRPEASYKDTAQKSENLITIRHALARSNNYAAVRAGMYSGLDSLSYFLENLFQAVVPPLPSSCLGAFELTPVALASSFSIFPNYGVQLKPHLISQIKTSDEQILYGHIDQRRRMLSPQVAYQVLDLLCGVVDEGTARSLRSTWKISGQVGGKTGTTNDYKDSWFVGFNSQITSCVWIGLDNPTKIMNAGYSSRIAVPAWGRIMKLAQKHYKPKSFPPPPGLIQVKETVDKGFWIFKKKQAVGRSEYIRPEQRDSMLLVLNEAEIQSLNAYRSMTNQKTWANRIKKWIGIRDKRTDKEFAVIHVPTPEEQATIYDNIKTHAPKARPVDP